MVRLAAADVFFDKVGDVFFDVVDAIADFLFTNDASYGQVCLLGILTGILLLLSAMLGSRRRRSKSSALKTVLWTSYTMTPYLIGYTMGLMVRSGFQSKTYIPDASLWSMYLLIAFGSADSLCAYSWLDSEQSKRYNWQFVLKLGMLSIIIFSYYYTTEGHHTYFYVIPFLIVAILLKVSTKNQSLEESSTSALERSCALDSKYLSLDHEAASMPYINHGNMEGYEFLVEGEEIKISKTSAQGFKKVEQVVTLENVWSCEGKLLSSPRGGDILKDCCMSFSLYKLLHLKYAGYKLPKKVHSKALRLFRNILLSEDENRYERVFMVVEEELSFTFDLFYTKRPLIFRPHRLFARFAEFILIGIVSLFLIFKLSKGHVNQRRSSTVAALSMYLLAEVMQFFILLFTTWTKVVSIREYVKRDSWRTGGLMERWAELICRLPSPKPWERKLHQYSLLESSRYLPCKLFSNRFATMFIDWTRDGQKEGVPIDLSGEVKAAVLGCLETTNGSTLGNGIASLTRHSVSDHLSWACKFETQTEVIMVWHIATTMCETRISNNRHSLKTAKNFRVATSLSKYLAYLVAFAPRLLPDHPSVTESSFDDLIIEVRSLLKGCKGVRECTDRLRSCLQEHDTTLGRGAKLGKQLLEETGGVDGIDVWEILAAFWVETMLYVAPSKDDRAHAEQLANGGEFVTHLWALLYNVGMKREKSTR